MISEKFKEAVKTLIEELPEWAKTREITVLAGNELLVHRLPGAPIKIKSVRCNLCGSCCMDYPNSLFGVDDEGKCLKLKKFGDMWECTAGHFRPYNCLQDPLSDPDCCIEYEVIE